MGWNGSDNNSARTAAKKSPIKASPRAARPVGLFGILIYLGLSLIVVCVGVWILNHKDAVSSDFKTTLEYTQQIVDFGKNESASVSEYQGAEFDRSQKAYETEVDKDNLSSTNDMPVGKDSVLKSEPTIVEMEPSRFNSAAESVLAELFTTELGDMPPPLPTISFRDEADLITHIDKMYEIEKDDSDRTKLHKETLNLVKKELDEFMRDGGDVNDFLQYYDSQLDQARELYLMSQQNVSKIVNDEELSREETIEYIKAVNKQLSAKGIKPVRLNKPQLEDLDITNEDIMED